MSARLQRVEDWPALAKQANWSVSELAKICGVSLSTLKRHFHQQMGKTPKAWLSENRLREGRELLQAATSVKEAAAKLGYQHGNQFSREFKRFWGVSPTASVQKTNMALARRGRTELDFAGAAAPGIHFY